MSGLANRSVFDWRFREQCFKDLRHYAGDIFNDNLVRALKPLGLEGCWSDDLSWIPIEGIDELVLERFRAFYTNIKGFHGCRPTSVSSYFENGLLGQNQTVVETKFREIFADIDDGIIEQAVTLMRDRGDSEHGKIYFVSDCGELINMSGHYLIQGSEYLMALAARLCSLVDSSREDYRFRLRSHGIPTIFEVDIPISCIPLEKLSSIAGVVVAEWCNSKLFPREIYNKNLCYIAHGDIPGKYIAGHHHPSEIADPHNGGGVYRVENPVCERCE